MFFFVLFFFFLLYFTLQYCIGFAIHWRESTTGVHEFQILNPRPTSLPITSLGHPSAPAPSILRPVSNIDWRFISYMIVYMFQCHSPKSSHHLPLPQSPKVRSIHLCLSCCLAYRVRNLCTVLHSGSFKKKKRGNICIHIADSLCSRSKTNTTL